MILWSLKYFSSCECQWYVGHFNLKWLSPLNSSNPHFCSHWATSPAPLPPFPPFSNKLLNLISFKAHVNIATFLLKKRESQPQWDEALGCQCGWRQPHPAQCEQPPWLLTHPPLPAVCPALPTDPPPPPPQPPPQYLAFRPLPTVRKERRMKEKESHCWQVGQSVHWPSVSWSLWTRLRSLVLLCHLPETWGTEHQSSAATTTHPVLPVASFDTAPPNPNPPTRQCNNESTPLKLYRLHLVQKTCHVMLRVLPTSLFFRECGLLGQTLDRCYSCGRSLNKQTFTSEGKYCIKKREKKSSYWWK